MAEVYKNGPVEVSFTVYEVIKTKIFRLFWINVNERLIINGMF